MNQPVPKSRSFNGATVSAQWTVLVACPESDTLTVNIMSSITDSVGYVLAATATAAVATHLPAYRAVKTTEDLIHPPSPGFR